jgi:hypothetical protein
MQGLWNRVHNACGVIGTPMQHEIFEQLQKVRMALLCNKKLKCMRCQWHCMKNMKPGVYNRHNIRPSLTALKGHIYQEHICSRIVLSHHTKLYKFKGAIPNKKCMCMRCHWHRLYVNRQLKSQISLRIRSRLPNGWQLKLKKSPKQFLPKYPLKFPKNA